PARRGHPDPSWPGLSRAGPDKEGPEVRTLAPGGLRDHGLRLSRAMPHLSYDSESAAPFNRCIQNFGCHESPDAWRDIRDWTLGDPTPGGSAPPARSGGDDSRVRFPLMPGRPDDDFDIPTRGIQEPEELLEGEAIELTPHQGSPCREGSPSP